MRFTKEVQATQATAAAHAVMAGRTITATLPLYIGGASSADLSANRTLSIGGLSSLGGANAVMGMNSAGTAMEWKAFAQAANQGVTIVHSANTITLGTAQDIRTSASPSFVGLTISSLGAGSTNTVVTHNSGAMQTRTIDSRVWGSSGVVVGASGTVNYLTKYASVGAGNYSLVNSQLLDNGTCISISHAGYATQTSGGYELAPLIWSDPGSSRWSMIGGLVGGLSTLGSFNHPTWNRSHDFLANWSLRGGTLTVSSTNVNVTVANGDGTTTGMSESLDAHLTAHTPSYAATASTVVASGVVLTFDFDSVLSGANWNRMHYRVTGLEYFRPIIAIFAATTSPTNLKVTVSVSSDGTATSSTVFTDHVIYDGAPTWKSSVWVGPPHNLGGSANNWIRRIKWELTFNATVTVDMCRILHIGLLTSMPTHMDYAHPGRQNRWMQHQIYANNKRLEWEPASSTGPWDAREHVWGQSGNLYLHAPFGRLVMGWDKSGVSTSAVCGVYEAAAHKFRPEAVGEVVQLGDATYRWNGLFSQGTINVVRPLLTDYALAFSASGDTNDRLVANCVGFEFGPGNAGRDTNLYRAGSNSLKTDDSFDAVGWGRFEGVSISNTSSLSNTFGVRVDTSTAGVFSRAFRVANVSGGAYASSGFGLYGTGSTSSYAYVYVLSADTVATPATDYTEAQFRFLPTGRLSLPTVSSNAGIYLAEEIAIVRSAANQLDIISDVRVVPAAVGTNSYAMVLSKTYPAARSGEKAAVIASVTYQASEASGSDLQQVFRSNPLFSYTDSNPTSCSSFLSYMSFAGSGGTSSSSYGYYSGMTVGSGHTVTLHRNFAAMGGAVTGTLTTQVGFYSSDLLGATSYGFKSDVSAGANKYSIHTSTALSYFGGVVQSAVSTGTAPFTIASTTLNTNLNADLWDGSQLNTHTASLRANHVMTGGGTITLNASYQLTWSARFIVIANGRGSWFSTVGFFDITVPAVSTVITAVGGGTNQTVVAGGIPLTNGSTNWVSLYYILPIGSGSASVPANFRLVSYTADFEVPEHWVLVAQMNGDSFYARLGTGEYIAPGQTLTMGSRNYIDTSSTAQTKSGNLTVNQLSSTVATGTAPLTVASVTMVNNLNVQYLANQTWNTALGISGSAALGGAIWDGVDARWEHTQAAGEYAFTLRHSDAVGVGAGEGGALFFIFGDTISTGAGSPLGGLTYFKMDKNGSFEASRLISNVSTGTAPLTVSSSTMVTNLNANYLEGQSGSYYTDTLNSALPTPSFAFGYDGINRPHSHLLNTVGDTIAFKTISNVEYWDGSGWVALSDDIQSLLTGRPGMSGAVTLTAAKRQFRFVVPISAYLGGSYLAVHQTFNTTGAHRVTVVVETGATSSGSWTQRVNETSPTGEDNYHFYAHGTWSNTDTWARITITSADATNSTSYTGIQLLYSYTRGTDMNGGPTMPMYWKANQWVGFGTTAPTHALHVRTTTSNLAILEGTRADGPVYTWMTNLSSPSNIWGFGISHTGEFAVHRSGTGSVVSFGSTSLAFQVNSNSRFLGQNYFTPGSHSAIVINNGTTPCTGSTMLQIGAELASGSAAVAQFNGIVRLTDLIVHGATGVYPHTNNVGACGISANRWNNVYSYSGNFASSVTIGGSLELNSADPRIVFYETDAAVGSKRNDFINQASQFVGRFYDDAGSVSANWLTVTRASSTPTVGDILLGGTTLSSTGYLRTYSGTSAGGTFHHTMGASGALRIGFGLYGLESGSNAGSNMRLWTYDDSGGFLTTVFQITRSTGAVDFYTTTTISGATILTSSNYTTYAPTTTGSGASGTWGISISGNAATVTNGVYTSRTISTQHSLTGGGDLSSNRTLNLVGDVASPGNSQYYGTNGSGTRGWYSMPAGTGTVTSVSVVSANGFAGDVATSTTTPAITIRTSVTGLLKGNGTGVTAAVADTDYASVTHTHTFTAIVMNTQRLIGRGTASSGASEEVAVTGAGGITASWAASSLTLTMSSTPTFSQVSVNGASGLTVSGGNSVLKAASTASTSFFTCFSGDPTTSGNALQWISPANVLSVIGGAASSHSHGNITASGNIGSTANLPLITGTSGIVQVGSFGTGANTFCQGNDSRLSDARTPTSHTHGNITNAGAIGSTTNLPVVTTTSGVLTVGSVNSPLNISGAGVWDISAGGISNSHIRQSSGCSVIGRSANSVGSVADIVASADGQYLTRSSGALTWSTISVDYTNVGGVANSRLLGRTTAGTGAAELITVSSPLVLGSGTLTVTQATLTAGSGLTFSSGSGANAVLVAGTLGIANNGVGDAQLRQGSALSVVGRSSNSTGNVADIAGSSDRHALRISSSTLGFGYPIDVQKSGGSNYSGYKIVFVSSAGSIDIQISESSGVITVDLDQTGS